MLTSSGDDVTPLLREGFAECGGWCHLLPFAFGVFSDSFTPCASNRVPLAVQDLGTVLKKEVE